MLSTNPYLHFMGTAEEAMNFYKSVLGGEFTSFQRYKDVPGGEKMPPAEQEKMIHASLLIDNTVSIMASDSVKPMGYDISFGNNFHICIQAETEAEVDRIFAALAKDGQAEMPPNKTFWGAYFAMCRDKFGVGWMMNYNAAK